jgi:mono/diheme cytochrome c family protein
MIGAGGLMYTLRSVVPFSLVAALAASSVGCDALVGEPSDEDIVDDDVLDPNARARLGDSRFVPWRTLRAVRQQKIDAYLASHPTEFESFKYAPLAATGVPTALLRNFSAAFPDIWGPPQEFFGPQGFGPDPFRAETSLPFGLGTSVVNGLELATMTCAGCHVGRVVGADGTLVPLVGAPNTRMNQFRSSIEATVTDPRYLQVFGENALTVGFRDKVLQQRRLLDSTLGAYTYNRARIPNAPDVNARTKPGFMDAVGLIMPFLTLPELLDPAQAAQIIVAVMPPSPAESDIMSVWRQGARPYAGWDGSTRDALYHNLGSQFGVSGDATKVDYAGAKLAVTLLEDLPPPPYPFDVDAGLALYGKRLYDDHCAGCHSDGNAEVYPASQTGTDPNRALTTTAENRRRTIAVLRTACREPAVCDPVPDDDIARDVEVSGRGYSAAPLDGIWARAPYLHNGSVPTLYHLLVPDSRPATFRRGSLRYDQSKVGYVWDDSAASDPYTHAFDTGQAGASRGGHDTAEFNGVDWRARPRELAALLEYLKTL